MLYHESPPSVEKSIVFFIHAVSTRHSNFRPLPLFQRGRNSAKPNLGNLLLRNERVKLIIPRNERRIILSRRKNLARFGKRQKKKGKKKH